MNFIDVNADRYTTNAAPAKPLEILSAVMTIIKVLIFGSGNKEILHKGGVGMVGSRAITPNEDKYAALAAEKFVRNDIPVITGGAKGIDEI